MDTAVRNSERLYHQDPSNRIAQERYERNLHRLVHCGNVEATLQLQALLLQLEAQGNPDARKRLDALWDLVLGRDPQPEPLWVPTKPANQYTDEELKASAPFKHLKNALPPIITQEQVFELCRETITSMQVAMENHQRSRLSFDDDRGWHLVILPDPATENLFFFNLLNGYLHLGETSSGCECPNCPCSRTIEAELSCISLHLPADEAGSGGEDFQDITEADMARVIIERPEIALVSDEARQVTTHQAPNGKHFTFADLVQAISSHESQSRARYIYDNDEIDRHHTSFGGIRPIESEPGRYHINWDS